MNADDAIRGRRSVRRYTARPVNDADVDAVLRLALLAPTGGMSQAWSFIVVRDEERRRVDRRLCRLTVIATEKAPVARFSCCA